MKLECETKLMGPLQRGLLFLLLLSGAAGTSDAAEECHVSELGDPTIDAFTVAKALESSVLLELKSPKENWKDFSLVFNAKDNSTAGYVTFRQGEGGGDVVLWFAGVDAPRLQKTLSRDLPLSNWTRFDVAMDSTVLLVKTGYMSFEFDDEKIRSFKYMYVHVDRDRYMNVRFDCVQDTSVIEVNSNSKPSPKGASPTADPPSSGGNGGAVAAVIIILLVVLAACLGVWWWWRKRREENTSSYNVQDVEKAMLEAGEAKGVAESEPLMASTSEGAAGGQPKGNFLTQSRRKLAEVRKAVKDRVRGREEDIPKQEGNAQGLCTKESEREGDGESGENIAKCQVGSKQEEAGKGRGDERQILENEQGEEAKEDTGRGEVKNGSKHEETEEREIDDKKEIGESKEEETKCKELMKEREDIEDEQKDNKENEYYREIEEDKKEEVGNEEEKISEEEKENEKEKRRDTEGKTQENEDKEDIEEDEEEEQRKTKSEEEEEESDEGAGEKKDEEQKKYENEERKDTDGKNQENEDTEDTEEEVEEEEEQNKARSKEEDSEEEAEEKQDEEEEEEEEEEETEEEEEEEGKVGLGIGGAEGEELQWRNPRQDTPDLDAPSDDELRRLNDLSEEELRDIDMKLRLLAVQRRILSVIDETPEEKRMSQYEREERRKRSEEASEGMSGMRETREGSVGKGGKEEEGKEGVEKGGREVEEEEEEDSKGVE